MGSLERRAKAQSSIENQQQGQTQDWKLSEVGCGNLRGAHSEGVIDVEDSCLSGAFNINRHQNEISCDGAISNIHP